MREAVKEYGRALADLAAEDGIEKEMLEQTRSVRRLLTENPSYIRLLATPEIPKAERLRLLREAFSDRIHPHLLHFLQLITERGYVFRIGDFLREYDTLYCERHGILTAEVTSAVPLSESQKTRLRKKLEDITSKTVELSLHVDPSLIGGIRLQIGNTLLEGSVRAKLDAMHASLLGITW